MCNKRATQQRRRRTKVAAGDSREINECSMSLLKDWSSSQRVVKGKMRASLTHCIPGRSRGAGWA